MDEAIYYFQRAQSVEYFSRAFQEVRASVLQDNFNIMAIGLALVVFSFIAYRSLRKYKIAERGKKTAEGVA